MCDSRRFISVESICNICLSKDRSLNSLKDLDIPSEWLVVGLNIKDGAVCWECEAVMKKCVLFKKKAAQAQILLHNGVVDLPIKSLSTLSYTNHGSESFDTDHIANSNNNVKIELLKENDLSYECVKEEISDNEYQFETVFSDNLAIDDNLMNDDELDDNLELDNDTNIKDEVNNSESEDGILNEIKNDYIELPITLEELLHIRNKEKKLFRFQKAEFKCESCVKIFYCVEQFDKHFNECHNEKLGQHICSICESRHPDSASLQRHAQNHFRQYKCRVCVFQHYSLQAMDTHTQRNHDKDTYSCKTCSAVFRSKRAHRNHMNTEHREPCKCDQCGKVMKSQTTLKQHIRLTHAQELLSCELCRQTFRGKKRLGYHMLSHSQRERDIAYCAECDLQFDNRYKYRIHLKSIKHGSLSERSKCPHCDKTFVNKQYVEQHISIVHLNKYNFVCTLCDKRFSTSGNLKIHTAIHHEAEELRKKHVCAVCGKTFTSKHGLKGHMNRHTGERPHKCEECGASFSQHGGLYKHKQRVHKLPTRARNT